MLREVAWTRISLGSLEKLSGDMEDCLEDKLITPEEYEEFLKYCKSAGYMSNQYIKAMSKAENKGSWTFLGQSRSNLK